MLTSSGAPTHDPINPWPSAPERRSAVRAPLEVGLGLYSRSNFYTGFTEDISSGGLFIATHQLLPVGETVEVVFYLPGGHEIIADAIVRWVRDPTNSEQSEVWPGMGVGFVSLSLTQQQVIAEYIFNRKPLFHIE